MKVIAIIPARLNSTRFNKKMLQKILGKTLLQRTFENTAKCLSLNNIFIATDSKEIMDHCLDFNSNCLLTSKDCQNGTERILDALDKFSYLQENDIIVNMQGDHPCIQSTTINAIINSLKNSDAPVSTAISQITKKEAENPNIVKCVFDNNYNALYFSRSVIPYSENNDIYYYHLGIYAYKVDFLLKYKNLKTSFLQNQENLEQLKILENGYKIKVAIVNEKELGVDTSEDITKIEEYLCL